MPFLYFYPLIQLYTVSPGIPLQSIRIPPCPSEFASFDPSVGHFRLCLARHRDDRRDMHSVDLVIRLSIVGLTLVWGNEDAPRGSSGSAENPSNEYQSQHGKNEIASVKP